MPPLVWDIAAHDYGNSQNRVGRNGRFFLVAGNWDKLGGALSHADARNFGKGDRWVAF